MGGLEKQKHALEQKLADSEAVRRGLEKQKRVLEQKLADSQAALNDKQVCKVDKEGAKGKEGGVANTEDPKKHIRLITLGLMLAGSLIVFVVAMAMAHLC